MAASAMKNIDEIPEEVVEIGLDAGILQASGKRIEHVSDRTGGKSRIGQWARIGLDLPPVRRSEEHTSELQSLMRISYAVFCLKKKNKTHAPHYNNTHKQPVTKLQN